MDIGGYALTALAVFLIGVSKSGVKGLGSLIVTLVALVFGAKPSTGFIIPLLIVGDILAVIIYKRLTHWEHIYKLLPAIVVGVVIAAFVGEKLPEKQFKLLMAILIIMGTAFILYRDIKKNNKIPTSPFFAYLMGLGTGFSSMLGNLAGAFSNVYFLAMQLPKNNYIGTAAILFFCINLIKLPFHIWYWKTINASSLLENLVFLPVLLLGFWLGFKFVGKIKDLHFRRLILFLTLAGALFMLLKD